MRSNHIPVMKKWHNAGDVAMVYMAVSFLGADIFVPSKMLEKAKELLESEPLDDDGSDDADELAEERGKLTNIRRTKAKIMVFFLFLIPILFTIIAVVFNILTFFTPKASSAPLAEVEHSVITQTIVSPAPTLPPTREPSPTPEPAPEPPINAEYFELMREAYNNNDIVGYLKIDGTPINYLVTQSVDNQYYLEHNIYKEKNKAGWVFLDFENDTKRDDLNTVIYAHNMRADIMFHSIRYYVSKDYFEEHRYITFNTEYANQSWEIFSVHRTLYDFDFDFIQVFFPSHDDFVELLMEMKSRSIYDTGVDVSPTDRVLTLVTCVERGASNERYVVNARLRVSDQ